MILVVNTAFPLVSVGFLYPEEGRVVLHTWEGKHRESLTLLPHLEELFRKEGKTPKDLQAVLSVTGPGSFTSLRIGIALANVYGTELGIPLYGVDSLEYLRMQESEPKEWYYYCPSERECYVRRGEEDLLLPWQAVSEYEGTKGGKAPNQEETIEHWEAEAKKVWQKLWKEGKKTETPLLVPYYLKAPNITEQKKR